VLLFFNIPLKSALVKIEENGNSKSNEQFFTHILLDSFKKIKEIYKIKKIYIIIIIIQCDFFEIEN